MSGREPGHAEFEPMALTPRKRRADPVLLGAVVVVVGLLVAVVKPWGDSATGEADASIAPAGSASIGAPTTGRPSSSPRAPAAEAAPAAIAWPRAAVAISPRDAWGVRAIVRDPDVGGRTSGGTAGLVERWSALTPGVAGTGVARLETADQGVLALGITFPPDELPIDARVWRSTEDDAWEWLYAVPLGPTPATGAFLFAPPAIDGSSLPTWPTGSYRIQVLAGPTIREIEVRLPDRFEVVPGPAEASAGESAESPFDPVFRSMSPDRPFVVQAGSPHPWSASRPSRWTW